MTAPGEGARASWSRSGSPARVGLLAPAVTRYGWLVLALAPGLWALWARAPLPIDETRYLTVAWEMWQRQDWLVPFLNGQPYSHKPPLLFWLINAGWWAFGVNEWWPRLINPLLVVVTASLAARIALRLWPAAPAVAARVPWVFAAAAGIVAFGQLVFFDLLLLACVLGALLVLLPDGAASRPRRHTVPLLGLLLAGGLLAKGPMVFLQVLLPAVAAPLLVPAVHAQLRRHAGAWLGRLGLASLLALAIAGLWAIPAARHGGADYAAAILWQQTAGRMVDSFAHVRPAWFYALALPALALPWSLATPWLLRTARGTTGTDAGTRLLLGWIVAVVVALSALSGKQPHYALPLLAPLALLVARYWPVGRTGGLRLVASSTVAVILLAGTVFFRLSSGGAGFDLRVPAQAVHDLQAGGAEVAVIGRYHGQLGFLGRLPRALTAVAADERERWALAHPGAYVVTVRGDAPVAVPTTLVGDYPYRSGRLQIRRIPPAAARPGPAPLLPDR